MLPQVVIGQSTGTVAEQVDEAPDATPRRQTDY